MLTPTRTAQIAGAGFAGLTAAAALSRAGWRVTVHEAAADPRAFGAGIFLWDNGLRVLRALGAEDVALQHSHEATLWEDRDNTGARLGALPFPLPGGGRMVTLTRAALHTALLAAAEAANVDIRTSSRIIAADPAGALISDTGQRHPGELLVAADGIRSRARDTLGLVTEHRTFPIGVYRVLVPRSAVPGGGRWDNYVNYWDRRRRRRVLYVPCNETDLYLLLGAHADDMAALSPTGFAHEEWITSFPMFEAAIGHIAERPRFDYYEHITLRHWSIQRLAVIGDAAHAMPPTIGQGAGTSMHNALELASHLVNDSNVESALRTWEADARPLTENAQRISVERVSELVQHGMLEVPTRWGSDVLRVADYVPST